MSAVSPHCQGQVDGLDEDRNDRGNTDMAVSAISTQNNHAAPPCIHFELNVLDFSPPHPWLTDVMWQMIAQQVVPDKVLSGEKGEAKIAVRMVLRQIRGLQTTSVNLPVYQYINTQFHLNKNQTGYFKIDSLQQRFEHSPKLNYSYYGMVDSKRQKQLSLSDILQNKYTKEDLLTLLQQTPKAPESGLKLLYNLPIDLPAQWYLDDKGSHLLYQPGEIIEDGLIARQTGQNINMSNSSLNEIIELIVPYELINQLLLPEYQLSTLVDVNNQLSTNQLSSTNTESSFTAINRHDRSKQKTNDNSVVIKVNILHYN